MTDSAPAATTPAVATPTPTPTPTPGIGRRLLCFVYEGVLLFGVLMAAGLVYGVVTQQRHALQGATGLQVFLFIVLGGYFVWFWSGGGQTLAMQTWHLRLVTRDGAALSRRRAACRYLLSWLWFAPGLVALRLAGLSSAGEVFGVLVAGVLGYAALARLRPDRQFLHDAACGTRLVTWQPDRKTGKSRNPARA